MRVLIAGVPRSGKTTRAWRIGADLACIIRHTDDLIASHDWSGASETAAQWFDLPGPWCIEGVAVARALRKWFASHPTGKPADRVIVAHEPVMALTDGQAAMAKGCGKVWAEVVPELVRRGVKIETM